MPRPPRRATTALFGRERELEILNEALAEAAEPGTRVVVIRGEAGIGKSVLMHRFLDDAEASATHVFAGRADVLERGVPYAAMHHALARFAPTADSSFQPLVDRLGDAMSLPAAKPEPVAEDRLALVLDAGWRLIRRMVRRGPVVIAVDDLHAADEETISLLRVLSRRLTGMPVLVVVSLRSNLLTPIPAVERFLGEVVADSRVTVIDLGPLRREHVEQLLADLAGEPATPAIVDEVLERSGGNAFFVAELGASLRNELSPSAERPSGRSDHVLLSRGVVVIQRLLPLGGLRGCEAGRAL